jgi:hypothetical protein
MCVLQITFIPLKCKGSQHELLSRSQRSIDDN